MSFFVLYFISQIVNRVQLLLHSTCVCPEGRLRIETSAPSWDRIEKANSVVKPGGEWSPADCRNTEKVAIVIPYRDREEHLRIFLNHMHPILQRQKISYRIFVVEQVSILTVVILTKTVNEPTRLV